MNTINTIDHSERAHAEFGPSSIKYVALCAGYQGKDGTSPAAEKGTRIHEALEVHDPSALHDEVEVALYDWIVKEEDEIFNSVFGGPDGVTIEREKRLLFDVGVESDTFGTSDVVAHKGGVGLQIDYKTGVSKIDKPTDNWQAKCYVLAGFQMQPELDVIHFAFIIPVRDEVLVGTFHRSDIPDLKRDIGEVITEAERIRPQWIGGTPDIDDLNPNVNCRFCVHEEHCPALGALCIEVAKRHRPDLLPDGPIASSEVDDPETIEKLFVVAKIVENWASGIKHKAVGMAHDGVEFETLHLRSMGSLKKTIEKNYLAQLAIRYGLTLEEVIEAADLTLNQVSDAIYKRTPKGKKGKIVEQFQKEAIDLNLVEVGKTRYTLSSK